MATMAHLFQWFFTLLSVLHSTQVKMSWQELFKSEARNHPPLRVFLNPELTAQAGAC